MAKNTPFKARYGGQCQKCHNKFNEGNLIASEPKKNGFTHWYCNSSYVAPKALRP